MKKYLSIILIFSLVLFLPACKKKDDISSLSTKLNNYSISINYDNSTHSADCKETLTYINQSTDALRNIKFHLYPKYFESGNTKYIISDQKLSNLYPNGISYASFNVSRVQIEEKDVEFSYEGDCNGILVVNLPSPLLPNKKVNISIDFGFTLPNCSHRFGYLDNSINLNNFYPIACVYENNDFSTSPYNSNGDPFYSELSNYKISLTCNNNLIVASSGMVTNKTEADNTTYTLEAKAVRDFGLVLSPNFNKISKKYKSTNIEYFYYSDEFSEDSLDIGVDAIKTFSKLFGEYPYKNLAIVQSDFVFGGMEYPCLVMISDDVTDPIDYRNVIVHEIAHQWWYGIVGNDEYKYPYIDESLAEFSCAIFYNENPKYELTYDDVIGNSKDNYSLFVTVYQDVLGTIDTSMRPVDQFNTEPEYTYITYVKGILMYDSLYKLIGKKEFYKAIKTYYEDNKFSFSTPEKLISSFSKSTKRDLTGFFSSWINGKVIIN